MMPVTIKPSYSEVTSDDIGMFVRMRRERIGWSQEQLAAAADVSLMTVRRWEKGVHVSQILTFFRALTAMGLTIRVVFGNDEQK